MSRPLSHHVYKRAKALGLTRPRIAKLDDLSDTVATHLHTFIQNGYHGEMNWIADSFDRRVHPKNIWPDAKSAIIVGLNYGPETDPMETLNQPTIGTISVYARNRDYHDILKGRLKELAGLVARDTQKDVKVFVDTAPLMEKPLAQSSGLGWQGKHTNLVSRDHGSWLFLGVILSAAELDSSPPETDHCGSCRACLDICPTKAFPAPYQLDARRCISYLTIEYKGIVEPALRESMGNRIYGCDDCLAVCPWNKFAKASCDMKLQARKELNAPQLKELAALDDASFRSFFSGSPIKRIGRDPFIRNVLYAIGNSNDPSLLPSVKPHLHSENHTIQDAAKWALERLSKTQNQA